MNSSWDVTGRSTRSSSLHKPNAAQSGGRETNVYDAPIPEGSVGLVEYSHFLVVYHKVFHQVCRQIVGVKFDCILRDIVLQTDRADGMMIPDIDRPCRTLDVLEGVVRHFVSCAWRLVQSGLYDPSDFVCGNRLHLLDLLHILTCDIHGVTPMHDMSVSSSRYH